MRRLPKQINENLSHVISIDLARNLHTQLNITVTRRTRILNNPRLMVWSEIEKLAAITKIPAWDLVYENQCGWRTLTLEDVHKYLEEIENKFKEAEDMD